MIQSHLMRASREPHLRLTCLRLSVPCTCSPSSSHPSRPTQALGTSYVNELDSQKALHNLKAWVQHNPKYSGLEIAVDEYSDGTLMDEVGGIETAQ